MFDSLESRRLALNSSRVLLILSALLGVPPLAAQVPTTPVAAAQPDHDDHGSFSRADFGAQVERLLEAQSQRFFGVRTPLASPASLDDVVTRARASARQRVLVAGGLRADFVTRKLATSGDMIAFWPDDRHYTHLILCVEQGRGGTTPGGNGGLNASVQRVDVATGQVATILHGMDRCDGIRRTDWGTILVTEETDDGRGYEILDPLGTTEEWVADRSSGDVRAAIDGLAPSTDIVQRQALPTMAWEGLAVLPSGVVIGGDELRPGSGRLDTDGGAIFKFVPDLPRTSDTPITDLSQSPLASGTVYALTVSCQSPASSSFPQFGQGCQVGAAAWVEVGPLTAREDAGAHGATGFYRPEDLHRDPVWEGPGVRFCWTNTGNEGSGDFSEVACAVDLDPQPEVPGQRIDPRTGFAYLTEGADFAVAQVSRFVEGDERFNSSDNLAFQPRTGIVYVVEDHPFGEIWACLRDGADRDLKSDGCISIASVADPRAEPTGFIFDGTGRAAFLVVQHGENSPETLDFDSNPVNGRTDDLIRITGFKLPR